MGLYDARVVQFDLLREAVDDFSMSDEGISEESETTTI